MALTDLAPTGLELDQWSNDLKEVYAKSTLMRSTELSKSPSSSSIASSSGASSYYSMESGISSMSAESTASFQLNYEHLLLSALDMPREAFVEVKKAVIKQKENMKIMYFGRDILDLGSNLKGGWNNQAASLPDGVDYYFSNRSQYSRLQNAFPPSHDESTCIEKDCSFVEPIYH